MTIDNKTRNTLIILFLVVLLSFIGYSQIFAVGDVGIADDYVTYDDFAPDSELRYAEPSGMCEEIREIDSLGRLEYRHPIKFCNTSKWDWWADSYTIRRYGSIVFAVWSRYPTFEDNSLEIGNYKYRDNRFKKTNTEKLITNKTFEGYDVKVLLTTKETSGYTNKRTAQDQRRVGGTIDLGGLSVRVSSIDTTPHTIEFYKSRVEDNLYSVIVNGREVKEGYVEDNPRLTITGTNLRLNEVKYRVPFGCEIRENEVLVYDEFYEGSEIAIEDLSNEPTKFCLNHAPVIRSLTEQGITVDERGEIFKILRNGNTVTVKEGETIRVPYITRYEEGMDRHCQEGEAIDTDTGDCKKIVFEEELEESRQAEIIPLDIEESTFQVSFNEENRFKNLQIGDTSIKTNLEFVCDAQIDERYIYPEPRKECWRGTLTVQDGEEREIVFNDSEIKISDYITVTPQLVSARYEEESEEGQPIEIDMHWNIKLRVVLKDFLDASLIRDNYVKELNSKENIRITIDNNIGQSFGGAVVRSTKQLLQEEGRDVLRFPVDEGKNTYNIPLDTSSLGWIDYEISPYIKIYADNEVIVPTDKIRINYKIVKDLEDITFEDSQSERIKDGFIGFWQRVWQTIIGVFT